MKFLSPYTVLPRPDDSYTIPILVLTLTFPSYLGFESTAVPQHHLAGWLWPIYTAIRSLTIMYLQWKN